MNEDQKVQRIVERIQNRIAVKKHLKIKFEKTGYYNTFLNTYLKEVIEQLNLLLYEIQSGELFEEVE
jgi:hypothetical protein